jgi:hypothetical protein
VTINRKGSSPLALDLTLEVTADANRIVGSVTDGNWTADLLANRAAFDKTANPSPWAGTYTMVLPGVASDASLPAGNGFAAIKIDASGNLRVAGSLADRTPFSQSVGISGDAAWPLYASLSGGKGLVWSWITFDTSRPNDDLNGSLAWIKKAVPAAKLYPDGFTNVLDAIGSIYQKPLTSTTRVLDLATATASFSGGNLPSDFSDQISIATNNKVTNESANKLSLNFAPATGLFTGSVTPPGTTQSFPFNGAVLQKVSAGYGSLFGPSQSSSVIIGQ